MFLQERGRLDEAAKMYRDGMEALPRRCAPRFCRTGRCRLADTHTDGARCDRCHPASSCSLRAPSLKSCARASRKGARSTTSCWTTAAHAWRRYKPLPPSRRRPSRNRSSCAPPTTSASCASCLCALPAGTRYGTSAHPGGSDGGLTAHIRTHTQAAAEDVNFQGMRGVRAIFSRARKLPRCTYHVFVASGMRHDQRRRDNGGRRAGAFSLRGRLGRWVGPPGNLFFLGAHSLVVQYPGPVSRVCAPRPLPCLSALLALSPCLSTSLGLSFYAPHSADGAAPFQGRRGGTQDFRLGVHQVWSDASAVRPGVPAVPHAPPRRKQYAGNPTLGCRKVSRLTASAERGVHHARRPACVL